MCPEAEHKMHIVWRYRLKEGRDGFGADVSCIGVIFQRKSLQLGYIATEIAQRSN